MSEQRGNKHKEGMIESLSRIIPKGKDNAIHQAELAKRLNVSPDIAKKVVRLARESGEQILSAGCGYWYATNDEEKRAWCLSMRRQALTRLVSSKSIRSSISPIDGQMSLEEAISERVKDTLDLGGYDEQRKV